MTFAGKAGRLEGIYRPAEVIPRKNARSIMAAVVCHPHPQHGGTMHNKVVFRAGKALERLGFAVLRFNYRGVGRSEGTFADGVGEADDVRSALDWVASENPGAPLVVTGFSFGSIVGLPVGNEDDRVTRLVGIGIPTDRFPFHRLATSRKPKLFVQGERDEYGPPEVLRAALEQVGKPRELVIVEAADHFFAGRLSELERAIVEWFSSSNTSDAYSSHTSHQ